jgi:two-component system, OmpR family, sensor kinase
MMRIGGIRAQLCLWYACLLALTLLALAGFTYALLLRMLHSRADAALLEMADQTSRQIAARLYQLEARGADPLTAGLPKFLNNDIRNWGRYLQVVGPNGDPVEWSDGLQSHRLPVHEEPLRRALAGQRTLETDNGLGEHPVRIVTVPVLMGRRVPLVVQAGTSLEGVDEALQRAGVLLLVLTPTVFVVAVIGGWLLVARALRRVDRLTRTALEIQGSNLQARIQHAGPDDEIGRLARAFDQMISRLERSFEQIRQFSADASHELKTPLTAIRGEAEVALMGELSPEEYRRAIRSILESSERMSEVVESLLLLARADSGQNLVRGEPVELGSVLLEAVESLETLARRQEVALEVAEVEDLTVPGDTLWLTQVITNLVSNGIKYTPAGGRVTVSLREAEGRAELAVHDTGIGIPEEHLPRIFDRFYRVDHGRARAAGGTGLGLSITRWAVEAHGGEISVESHAGRGSTFRVLLPLLAKDAATDGPPHGELQATAAARH